MMPQEKTFTTLLSDITPEIEQALCATPEWDSSLPKNAYPALELKGVNTAFRHTVTDNRSTVMLHSHSFFEYIFCHQVPEMEYLIDTYRYRIQAGDVIYIPPGTPHRPILPSHCTVPFVRDELWMRTEFAAAFGQRLPGDFLEERRTPYLLRPSGALQTEISGFFQKGLEESSARAFRWDNAADGYATLLLVTVARTLLDERTQFLRREEITLFDRINLYLEENLDKKITLDSISDQFFVSKSTVNRTFQKHMGTSFYRCLTQRRLLAAQHLIWNKTALEEVSVKVGFSDYATFYRAFKQAYGISPRQYQKLHDSSKPAERFP